MVAPAAAKAEGAREAIPNIGNNGGGLRNSPVISSWSDSLPVSYKVTHIL